MKTLAALMVLVLAPVAPGTAAASKPDLVHPELPKDFDELLQQAMALAPVISEKDGTFVVDVEGAVAAGVNR